MLSRSLALLTSALLPICLAQAQDDARTASSQPEPLRIAGVYEATAEALDTIATKIDRATFDPEALAATLGETPDAARDWVAGHIAPAAYAGALKGPAGTLMDRQGNSLDRALLIAALLKAKGVEVRLAHAPVDDATAGKLVAAIRNAAITPIAPATADTTAVDKLLADPRIDQAKMRAKLDARRSLSVDSAKKALDMTIAVTGQLEPIAAPLNKATPEDARVSAAREAVKDHWWVQANSGGNWIDVDPDGGLTGTLIATETVAPDALPAALMHAIQVKVIAEFWDNGSYREETLLTQDLATMNLAGQSMLLTNRPLGMKDASTLPQDEGYDAAVIDASAKARAWVPMLIVTDQPLTDRLVDVKGLTPEANTTELALRGGAEGEAAMGGSIGGVLGGMTDAMDGNTDEATSNVRFTSERVEITITSPGQAPRTIRRAVFDIAPPATRADPSQPPELTEEAKARRGFAMMESRDILVITGDVAPPYIEDRIAKALPATLRSLATWLRDPGDSTLPAVANNYRPLNTPPLGYASVRTAGEVTAPNVVIFTSGLRATADAKIGEFALFDIVDNRLTPGLAASDAWGQAVKAGVADTVAEYALMGLKDDTHNAAARFDTLGAGGWTVVNPGDTASVSAMGYDASVVAAMSADLNAGYGLIVPTTVASAADAAWWRVDPATGETLGMTAMGGSEFTEWLATNQVGLILVASCGYKWGKANAEGTMNTGKALGVATCLGGAIAGFMGVAGGNVLSIIGNIADP